MLRLQMKWLRVTAWHAAVLLSSTPHDEYIKRPIPLLHLQHHLMKQSSHFLFVFFAKVSPPFLVTEQSAIFNDQSQIIPHQLGSLVNPNQVDGEIFYDHTAYTDPNPFRTVL